MDYDCSDEFTELLENNWHGVDGLKYMYDTYSFRRDRGIKHIPLVKAIVRKWFKQHGYVFNNIDFEIDKSSREIKLNKNGVIKFKKFEIEYPECFI